MTKRVLVLGAAGFIGSRMVRELRLRGDSEIYATDVRPPRSPLGVEFFEGNVLEPTFFDGLFRQPFDTVIHLAAALTLDAEADFARGLQVNVLALMRLLEECRGQGNSPKFLFASSISTFGGKLPETVDDSVFQTPQTSYGSHKVIAEQLINDYSRRGYLDGRVLRLPVVITHPGPPTGSVSDRIASLIREPLNGQDTVCPVAPDTPMPFASVDRVVRGFLKLHDLPSTIFGATRAMNLPALTATPNDLIAAVERASPGAGKHITISPYAPLQRVVDDWPRRFTSKLALENGIESDVSADELVTNYLAARNSGI